MRVTTFIPLPVVPERRFTIELSKDEITMLSVVLGGYHEFPVTPNYTDRQLTDLTDKLYDTVVESLK